MISGIVEFSEIIENVKDIIGLTNIDPYLPKIRRSIINAENDIGGGTLLVRKERNYIAGEPDYNGNQIKIPADLMGEYFYEQLNTVYLEGKYLKFYETPGPDEITLVYVGWLLDEEGNPYTSRNRLEAVKQRILVDLYRTKVYLRQGNANQLAFWQKEYDDLVLAARGNDVMPTDAEWSEIGRTFMSDRFMALENDLPRRYTDVLADPAPTELTVDMIAIWNAHII